MKEINNITIFRCSSLPKLIFSLFRILGGQDEIFIINELVKKKKADLLNYFPCVFNSRTGRTNIQPLGWVSRSCQLFFFWQWSGDVEPTGRLTALSPLAFDSFFSKLSAVNDNDVSAKPYWSYYRAPTLDIWAQICVHALHRDIWVSC